MNELLEAVEHGIGSGGACAVSIGHAAPEIPEAMARQFGRVPSPLGGHTARRSHYLLIFQYTPHIEPADCYRCGFGDVPESCRLQGADQLERSILREGPDSVGAFIAEPVMANGLSSGCTPLEALMVKEDIYQTIRRGSGVFVHGPHLWAKPPVNGHRRCGASLYSGQRSRRTLRGDGRLSQ